MVEQISEKQQTNLITGIRLSSDDYVTNCLAGHDNNKRGDKTSSLETDDNSDVSGSLFEKNGIRTELEKDENLKSLDNIAAMESYVNGSGEIEPFFIYDEETIINQDRKWRSKLPRVTPFYAVKCNNHPALLGTLLNLQTNFDCASLEEIKTMLELGVAPERIIYANPCKSSTHIKYAAEKGVFKLTFDNADELIKVKQLHPKAQLVIRIHVDDSKSVCQFGVKFGVHQGMTRGLLELAKKLDLDVIGVSFHVGSGCLDASAFSDALKRARDVFDEVKEVGYNPFLLDIGGGFPGLIGSQYELKIEFDEIANEINVALEKYFADYTTLEIIGEPGRFYAASSLSLVANIISKRTIETPEGKSFMYYINDGIYGSFNSLMFDHALLPYPRFLVKNPSNLTMSHLSYDQVKSSLYASSIWGPTCDSIDCLSKFIKLPELNIGDWLIFDNMGAYTLVAASRFNGMNIPKVFYLNSESSGVSLKEAYGTEFIKEKRSWIVEDHFFT